MSSDWKSGKLGDFIELKRGYDLPKTKRLPGFVPLVSSSGVSDCHSVSMVKGPGVITGRYGTIGQVYFVEEDFWPLNTTLYIRDFKGNNPKYISYFLKTVDFSAYSDKAAVPGINRNHLHEAAVTVPDLRTQKEIASVLGALDDRIALLRETNATLEAIAQAMFKSWFVDFDPVHAKQQGRAPEGMDAAIAALFPDSFEESELGLVPKGWKVGVLESCCSRVESGGTPKRTTPDYWNGNISWLTSGEVRNPIVFETKEKITELGIKESSAKIWPEGTTVVAMYGATAGEVCLLAKPTTANQACCGLIPRKYFRSFLFFCVRRERETLASKSSGSAQQNLNKGIVSAHRILIPSEITITAYENIVGLLLNRWIDNEQQAQTLATLRDTLLPRLISGQLRLPEAEAPLEEADA